MKKFLKLVLCGVALFVLLMLTPRIHGFLLPGKPPVGYHFLWSTYLAVAAGLEEVIDTDPEIPGDIDALHDIEFKNVDGKSVQLDLYRPKQMEIGAPLLIMIHGGSWRWGHRSDMVRLLVDFAQRGYATATLSYRLEGYPASVEDVVDGINWLYDHSEEYGYDRDRIALVGASAGAHLALLVAYGWSGAPEDDTPALSPDRVKAVVNLFGPVDLTTSFAVERPTVSWFFGRTYDEDPELYAHASPISHVHPGAPPTLTIHGTSDEIVPNSQADQLSHRLDSMGVVHEDYRFPLWPHALILVSRVYDFCMPKMDDFLRRHLSVNPQPVVRHVSE